MKNVLVGVGLLILWQQALLAQIDPEKRQSVQVGYNQPIEGKAPVSGYAFYYLNSPHVPFTNSTLRLAVSAIYLDTELGFTGPEETDWAVGLAGGGFADSYNEFRTGRYIDSESFVGHGGEVSFSLYHRFNPSQKVPLSGVLRASPHFTTYERDSDTSPLFILPDDFATMHLRTGLRLGGREPTMLPSVAAELSAWYDGQLRSETGTYGFGDRKVERMSHLFWARALFIYTLPNLKHNISLNITTGTSIDPDRFSAYRIGGLLPMASEFPLALPGYFYQELSAERFVNFSGQYTLPIDRNNRWTLTGVGSVAKVAFFPAGQQPGRWHSGVGLGIGYKSPRDSFHTVLGYSYGIDATRDHGKGAQSIGLLFQWDLEAKHRPNQPLFDIESPQRSRGFFEMFN